ncbi:putative orf21 protein [Erysiphe necator]|uniref:Putative orf21 protein n=1 Tax=Uncinula necator TaxID=52586 RepID=A0A0B1P5F1_UNCNE|nr:putative orf21 protein [Erysiphe necator]
MLSLKRKNSSLDFHASSPKFTETNTSSVSQSTTWCLHPSRTRKRHRNSRPCDSVVYERTLSLLYSAQQSSSPLPQDPSNYKNRNQAFSHLSSINLSNQKLLSSLWNCPSNYFPQNPSRASPSADNTLTTKTSMLLCLQKVNCEDCDVPLNIEESAIDIREDDYTCATCGKYVCQSCSISYMDMERKCLICVDKKT